MSKSAKPRDCGQRIVDFVRDAGNKLSDRSHFSACISFDWRSAASVMSVNTMTMLDTFPCSSRMGLRLPEKLPHFSVAAEQVQINIVDLASSYGRRKVRLATLADEAAIQGPTRDGPGVAAAQTLQIEPPSVGITDQSGSIHYENQTLRVIENLVRKIALPLQFNLRSLQARNIKHQTPVLKNVSFVIHYRERIDQYIGSAIHLCAAAFPRSS